MSAAAITGATQMFGVVGDPVAHSLSPLIHNRWIAEARLDAVYGAYRLQSDRAADDLRAMARAGIKGLNVTLPHKIAALQAADDASDLARRIGAANTLAADGRGGWIAHNTDVAGFASLWSEATVDRSAQGKSVLLIGAGGAARAALCWLADEGAEISIANRTPANAERLAQEIGVAARVGALADLERMSNSADVVINSASFGHEGGEPPGLGEGGGRAFLDMSYGKAAARMMANAQQAGWAAHDGLAMLTGQAAESFRIWFGVTPDEAGALAMLRSRR